MRRLLAHIVALVAVALPTLVLGAPAQAEESLTYVALGDSYSAGSGVLPLAPGAAPQCTQSARNYPHVIAATIGASLTDVTCGGAATRNLYVRQYPGVDPQLDALGTDTDLVTITIGGNDQALLLRAAGACGAAGILTLGTGAPCTALYKDSFVKTVATIEPRLHLAFAAIRERAPHARVAVLGYPDLLPPTTGCYRSMPIARGDVPYLFDLQARLNQAVERAAIAEGATFVDFSEVSRGHDACKPPGTRWIEPIFFPVGDPAFVHPNALGEREMAAHTLEVLGLG